MAKQFLAQLSKLGRQSLLRPWHVLTQLAALAVMPAMPTATTPSAQLWQKQLQIQKPAFCHQMQVKTRTLVLSRAVTSISKIQGWSAIPSLYQVLLKWLMTQRVCPKAAQAQAQHQQQLR